MSKRKRDTNEEIEFFSSDDEVISNIQFTPTPKTPERPKKRVKFDADINDSLQQTIQHYKKYNDSAMNLPSIESYIKLKIGDGNNRFNNFKNKQLWLFKCLPNFDVNKLNNVKISISRKPQIGTISESINVGKNSYKLMEIGDNCDNYVNLFPKNNKLIMGKPFERSFCILNNLDNNDINENGNEIKVDIDNVDKHERDIDKNKNIENGLNSAKVNKKKKKSKKKKNKNKKKKDKSDKNKDIVKIKDENNDDEDDDIDENDLKKQIELLTKQLKNKKKKKKKKKNKKRKDKK